MISGKEKREVRKVFEVSDGAHIGVMIPNELVDLIRDYIVGLLKDNASRLTAIDWTLNSTWKDDGKQVICHFPVRVFNAHNLPSGDGFVPWVGRMNDDLINAINVWRRGGMEMSVKFLSMNMPPTQSESGGLSELYRSEGTVRKTAYAVMAAPGAVRLVKRFKRYHHAVDWGFLVPKVVHDRWRKA